MARIAFWTASHLPDLGGLQWSTFRLAKALNSIGHEPVFITRETKELDTASDVPVLRFGGDTVYDWTVNSGQWLIRNRFRFDIIHVIDCFYRAVDQQLEFLLSCGLPVVLKIPTAGYIPKLIVTHELQKKFGKINAFCALNMTIVGELIQVGIKPNQIYQIPNGVGSEEFKPASDKQVIRKKLLLPEEKVLVLFAGRLVHRKRLDILLKAMTSLVGKAYLVIVGSGFGQRDSTETEVVECVSNAENLILHEPATQMIDYYHACDIHALLSEREGMPNSILEAMSCGLPNISTKIPGITDLITHGKEGLLVPVGDVLATEKSLMSLVENFSLRVSLGEAARRKVLAKFDLDIIARQYENLYKQLLNKRGVST